MIYIISIHTPVKGVTVVEPVISALTGISIHTPVKGVTFDEGADRICEIISIHTPVKGVTVRDLFADLKDTRFQSTHP